MDILINDLMQFSDLPDDLKSPSLATRYPNSGLIAVDFNIPSQYSNSEIIDGILSQPLYDTFSGVLSMPLFDDVSGVPSQPLEDIGVNEFNCIGIGGTDATEVILNGTVYINSPDGGIFQDGLYDIGQTLNAGFLTIEHNGSYMGRIAIGQCRSLCISPTRETGFYTTEKRRRSISGQVIPSAGGYSGGQVQVDFRYKFTRDIIEDFNRAYATQIAKGFPFFIDFQNEKWLYFQKFYGDTDNNLLFQSSINGFKWSKMFMFKQAF